jgi:hypothetical protein
MPVVSSTTRPSKPPRKRLKILERLATPVVGRPIFAVAWLTLKAAFRYRLVQILTALLLLAVIGMPALIKHDGTAQGFTQILLTYTLGSITLLLGFATLWLACGTLARDVEECQMQMVAVKPIARWQIWLGKWLGLLVLNALLLATSGLAIYGVLQWRASLLPAEAREELQTRVLVARSAIQEPIDYRAIEREVDRLFQERIKEAGVAAMDRTFVRDQIRERVIAQFQIVRPGMARRWNLDFGSRGEALRDRPLTVRARFYAAQPTRTGTYYGAWEIGPPEGRRYRPEPMSLADDTIHEFLIPPGLIDMQGRLSVDFQNFNETALLFPLEDGLVVLYEDGSFAPNFARGLVIVLCWLALLAAIGLAAASILSFPVAAFVSLAVLIVGFSTGTLRQIVEEGGIAGVDHHVGFVQDPSLFDRISVRVFGTLLSVINLVQGFSPVESLSDGRTIGWGEVGRAILQILVLMAGLFAIIGITLFTRRELATAQSA